MSDEPSDDRGRGWRRFFEWRLPEEDEIEPPEPPWTRLDVLRLAAMASFFLLNLVPWSDDLSVGWPWRRAVLEAALPFLPGPPGKDYAWFMSYEAEQDWLATLADGGVCLALVALSSGVTRLGVAGQTWKLSLHGVLCLLIGATIFFALARRWPVWWAWPLLMPGLLAVVGATAWAAYGLDVLRRRAIGLGAAPSRPDDDSHPLD